VNIPKQELIKAYLATVEKCQVGFEESKSATVILNEYEDGSIDIDTLFQMRLSGINVEKVFDELPDNFLELAQTDNYRACENSYGVSPKMAAMLFLEFCKTSLPELEYEIIEKEYLFGYWGELNISVGYGIFFN